MTRGAVVVGAAVAALSACGPGGRLPEYGALPDFTMTSVGASSESPFGLKDMRGKVWVADFVFTHCSGPCPLLTQRMVSLSARLPPSVGLLTLTVDPETDTPERLRAYAKAYGADRRRWVFLRGGVKETYELMYAGFRLPMSTDPKAPDGRRVIHSTRLALVDAAGTVRGYYDGLSDVDEDALARDARRLLEVAPR